MLRIILNKIDGLDNVHVVQSGRYAEFCRQFLDIFFFGFVLPPLPEFLANQ
jgi:hypothetical protein